MKCEHGNEITVVIELHSPVCWDDGIWEYNEKGEDAKVSEEVRYVKVTGCDHEECKLIKLEKE